MDPSIRSDTLKQIEARVGHMLELGGTAAVTASTRPAHIKAREMLAWSREIGINLHPCLVVIDNC